MHKVDWTYQQILVAGAFPIILAVIVFIVSFVVITFSCCCRVNEFRDSAVYKCIEKVTIHCWKDVVGEKCTGINCGEPPVKCRCSEPAFRPTVADKIYRRETKAVLIVSFFLLGQALVFSSFSVFWNGFMFTSSVHFNCVPNQACFYIDNYTDYSRSIDCQGIVCGAPTSNPADCTINGTANIECWGLSFDFGLAAGAATGFYQLSFTVAGYLIKLLIKLALKISAKCRPAVITYLFLPMLCFPFALSIPGVKDFIGSSTSNICFFFTVSIALFLAYGCIYLLYLEEMQNPPLASTAQKNGSEQDKLLTIEVSNLATQTASYQSLEDDHD
eukprot:m.10948 g.10948  ORF g.10948 m.10948 type:complete len:330 (+) comp22824_c0_seq1:153-1142(+)